MRRLFTVASCLAITGLACNPGRDQLLTDLQSERAEQRALAVHKLGDQHKADDLILFTRAARDPSALVRAEAATALGRSGSAEIVDLLSDLVEDSDESVQIAAVGALARFPDEKSRRFLQLQFSRRSRVTREAIVETLRQNGVPDASAQLIQSESKLLWERYLRALTGGSLAEQVSASEALGQSGRPEAVEILLAHVKDPQIPLAAAALRGLGMTRDPRAVPTLLQTLTENYPELREAAMEGLRRLHAVEASAPLLALAKEGGGTAASAVRVLADMPRSAELEAALCGLALEAEDKAAAEAARQLATRGGCPADALRAGLSKKSSRARIVAALRAMALWGGQAQAREAIPEALGYLTSKDPETLRLALLALGATGADQAVEPITALYNAEWTRISAAREKWVKEPPPVDPGFDPSVVPKLAVLHPEEDDARKEQLQQLLQRLDALDAQRRGTQVQPAGRPPELAEDVSEASVQLAAAALEALGDLKAPEALAWMKRHAADESKALRDAAGRGAVGLGPEGIALAEVQLKTGDMAQRQVLAQRLCAVGDAGKQAVGQVAAALPAGQAMPLLEQLDQSGPPASSLPVLAGLVRRGGAESILAARLLGRLKARATAPVLRQVLQEPTSVARRDVLWALGQMGDRDAAPLIAHDLFHESPEIREAAAQALGTVGSASQRPTLQALERDYFRDVREAAAGALAALPQGIPEAAR